MSESANPTPAAPTAAPKSNSNALILVGIIAICGSILYVGSKMEEVPSSEPTIAQMTLGDDFWLNLPPEVAAMRDQLAVESHKLSELRDTIADKLEKAENLDDGPDREKLDGEIEAVIGEQQVKVRHLQRDFVRRINGLRTTYIVKNVNK